ncbi:MAG: ribosome silencing factor [Thermosynechococcus sp.]|uniref:ribosome silencing factor n=1 Tax=Thermosynechococcus sp. TaxID=2814275 RepID=UPI003919C098
MRLGDSSLTIQQMQRVAAITDPSLKLAWTAAYAADDRKGVDICLLDVSGVSYLTDYFVIITGLSKTQVRAIYQGIEEAVLEHCQRQPQHIEGQAECSWVLMDYGDVIVHVQLPKERQYYNLEAFWGHAQRIPFESLITT